MTRQYQHKEAFCLMWYGCPCGHKERIWNSRDGVTPFGTLCPSCGQPSLQHMYFGSDLCVPNHKPAHGQRVWISMTAGKAQQIAQRNVKRMNRRLLGKELEAYIKHIYNEGREPDLAIAGYDYNP